MGPFDPREELPPHAWPTMDEGSQILFNYAIQNLCLSINLGVIREAHSQKCPTQTEEFLQESADENRVSIEDQAPENPMDFDDNVDE